MSSLAEQALIEERRDTIEYLVQLLDEHWRHGSADVRVAFTDVPRSDYDEIDGQVVTRFPEGEIKVERPCIGVVIEWIPQERT